METPQSEAQETGQQAEALATGASIGGVSGADATGVEQTLPLFTVESLDPLLPRDIWQPLRDPVLNDAIQHWVIVRLLQDGEVRDAMQAAAAVPADQWVVHSYPTETEGDDWPVDWDGEWQGVNLIYAAAHALHHLVVLEPAWLFVADNALPDRSFETRIIDFEDVGGSCVSYGTLRGVPVRVGLAWRTEFVASGGTTRFCFPEHDLRVTIRPADEPLLRERFSDIIV